MRKKIKGITPRRLFPCLLVVGMLITIVCGCDRYTYEETLPFFFTGVPPYEEEKKGEAEKDKAPQVPEGEKKAAPQVTLYTHPLTVARLCSQCHQTTANFAMFGQKARPQVFRKGTMPPGPLAVPRKELCITCHKDKSAAETLTEGLWLHPTSAKGDCYACHDPHQSTYPHILLAEPAKICSRCHTEADMMPKVKDKEAHRQPGECLACHNPHLGRDRLLLKKDYKELKRPVEPVPGFPGFPAVSEDLPAGGSTTKIK